MPELSNLLRQRLAATESGGNTSAHPDPDVLTAYMEHCLPATERQTVVAHLSMCGPCREVVALSQPQIPELAAQTVVRSASASVWRRLFTPAFGIAGAVAAVAIIAVLVLQLPQKSVEQSALTRTTETQQAKATPALDQPLGIETSTSPDRPAAAQSASTANMDIAVPVKKASVVELRAEARNRIAAGSNAPAPPSPERTLALTTAMQKKDYINTNFFAANDADRVSGIDGRNAKLPATPQPLPSLASSPLTVTGGNITIFSDISAPNAQSKSNVRMLAPTPPSQHFGLMLGKMATATAHTLHLHTPGANPPLRASNLGYSTLGGLGMFSNNLAKSQSTEVSAAPEKLESGSLAKSDALSAGAMGGANARSLDTASTLWKVAGGKLIKSAGPSQWEDAYPTSSFEFSVVNTHGNDVWAGGTHASIIHSRDGGLTWENIKLGDAATGTIVSILPGALNVNVKTSDNQLWLSTDGGKTWTMQND